MRGNETSGGKTRKWKNQSVKKSPLKILAISYGGFLLPGNIF